MQAQMEADIEVMSFDALVEVAEKLCENRNKKALEYIERASFRAKHSDSLIDLSMVKYLRACYHSVVLNEYDECISIINGLLDSLEYEELSFIGAKIFITLGNAYQLKGEVFECQRTYLQGIRLLENKKLLTDNEKRCQASIYYNITLSLTSSHVKIDAQEYLDKAIAIYTELEATDKLSRCYILYSGFYEEKGDFKSAVEMLVKALNINKTNNDSYSIALTQANLGIIISRMGKYQDACSFLLESVSYFEQHQSFELAMVRSSLGECQFRLGQHSEGLQNLYEAEEILSALDNKQELSKIYQLLAGLLKEDGQFEKCVGYLQKYNESLQYFFDTEKTLALARAKKEFESEQQEKESLLLRQKNEEIKLYVHKLENSNNSLKQFAQVASHDLREPLRMISCYMTLLEKSLGGNINDQQKEFLGFATDGARRMEQLIMDMLHLAKVDANPKIEKIKLVNIMDEIRLNLDVLIKEKDAMIFSGPLPVIKADRTQMLQLFQNLIANGLKYNESRSPIVKVKCTTHDDHFEITVTDNGIGIPEEYKDKVFDIFRRLHTSKTYSGSGIGLSVCKKIVDSMNGRISILDNPNGGSIFKITLKNEALA